MPVGLQQQVMVVTVQNTAEVPHVQFIDKVLAVPCSGAKAVRRVFSRFTGIFRAPSIRTLSARGVSSGGCEPSMANSCWLSRAREWRGRRESDS